MAHRAARVHTVRTPAEDIQEIRRALRAVATWMAARTERERQRFHVQARRAERAIPASVLDFFEDRISAYGRSNRAVAQAYNETDDELARWASRERRRQFEQQYEVGGGFDEQGWRPVDPMRSGRRDPADARAAILRGDARAWGRVADRVRRQGGTYRDAFGAIRAVFTEAGRRPPTLREFEEKMQEADD